MIIQFLPLPHGKGVLPPTYKSPNAAGMDLSAAVQRDRIIYPGERAAIPLGFRAAIQPGYEAQIRTRSGLALNSGIFVANSPGTIDEDYRGEWMVILCNSSNSVYTVRRGDRIAQLVIAPVVRAELVLVDHLDNTERGDGGFGSTGI